MSNKKLPIIQSAEHQEFLLFYKMGPSRTGLLNDLAAFAGNILMTIHLFVCLLLLPLFGFGACRTVIWSQDMLV